MFTPDDEFVEEFAYDVFDRNLDFCMHRSYDFTNYIYRTDEIYMLELVRGEMEMAVNLFEMTYEILPLDDQHSLHPKMIFTFDICSAFIKRVNQRIYDIQHPIESLPDDILDLAYEMSTAHQDIPGADGNDDCFQSLHFLEDSDDEEEKEGSEGRPINII